MSEEGCAPKKPKLDDEGDEKLDQYQMSLAGPSNEPPQSKIFKLNIDCFDEIFEYLSLDDLHSFGQTCKAMNKVAGEYFKQNFSAAASHIDDDGPYTNIENTTGFVLTSGFNCYITHIAASFELPSYFYRHIHEFESLTTISFVRIFLDEDTIHRLQQIFSQLQMVRITSSIVDPDIYETMLRLCVNLKRLHLVLSSRHQPELETVLANKYPRLEYFEWTPIQSINELNLFFQINPNVQSFSTDIKSIWMHRDEIMKFNVQLDVLELKQSYHRKPDLTMLSSVLNQLFERKFFKRLHFFIKNTDTQTSIQLSLFRGLEKLCIDGVDENFYLPSLPNLKEFEIVHDISKSDAEMIANNLVNLRRLTICQATHEIMLPFIRQSIKLCNIKLHLRNKDDILKLHTLNMERQKLTGARKVTIYTSESTFLATKWATHNGNINLKLIELKRISSCE